MACVIDYGLEREPSIASTFSLHGFSVASDSEHDPLKDFGDYYQPTFKSKHGDHYASGKFRMRRMTYPANYSSIDDVSGGRIIFPFVNSNTTRCSNLVHRQSSSQTIIV